MYLGQELGTRGERARQGCHTAWGVTQRTTVDSRRAMGTLFLCDQAHTSTYASSEEPIWRDTAQGGFDRRVLAFVRRPISSARGSISRHRHSTRGPEQPNVAHKGTYMTNTLPSLSQTPTVEATQKPGTLRRPRGSTHLASSPGPSRRMGSNLSAQVPAHGQSPGAPNPWRPSQQQPHPLTQPSAHEQAKKTQLFP